LHFGCNVAAAVLRRFRTASALLPHRFRAASAPLPRCFRTAPLPHRYMTWNSTAKLLIGRK
jgi:hypothetical protein